MNRIKRDFFIPLGHLLRAEVNSTTLTTYWDTRMIPGGTREQKGADREHQVVCPICHLTFNVTVESYQRARFKQRVYIALGALIFLSLIAWIPLFFDAATRVVDETNPDPVAERTGPYFALMVTAFIAGIPLFVSGRRHLGIKKLRLVRADGTSSRLVKGHRLK